jgi:apolipoprotein D and lipocalin family protein
LGRLFLRYSIIAALGSPAFSGAPPAFVPVKGFSLERYLGSWYEIARMPVSFEKDLSKVTATYVLRKDGKVDVINQGYKTTKNNKKQVAKGKAKFAASSDIGHLRVSFFGPFYADYIVLALDENYSYAMVTSNSNKYLWILSRTPKLEQTILNGLLAKAKELGFDVEKLIMVEQES